MADNSMRSKAAAIFGKEFMNTVKGNQPSGMQQNAAAALQKRANARPIPVYKEGGKISSRVANRAAMAGYKHGGKSVQTSSDTARKLAGEMGGMKDGGEAKYKAKLERKMADIEKDYAKAKAKNPDVAKAKYEQRVADAKDDYAKWTKSDRSETSKAEKAAEAALSEARRTKGMSIRARDMAAKGTQVSKSEPSDAPKAPSVIEGPGLKPTMGGMPSRKAVKAAAPKVAKPPRPALVKTEASKPAAGDANMGAFMRSMGKAPAAVARPGMGGDTNRIAGAMGRAPAAVTAPTFEQKRAAKLQQLKAAADAPGASRLAKDRYRYAAETGMVQLKDGGKPCKLAVGGTGKMRKGCAPIKRKEGGTTKREGISTRPTTPSGRRITIEELNATNRDTGGMSAAQLKATGEAIGRGNRSPKDKMPVKRAKGGAGKVRKGMMTQKGDITKAVKPKKGIGGFM